MKVKYLIPSIISIFLLSVNCGGPSEPKEYIHTQAGFKITAPAGWNKTQEDNEMYEFRSGNYKLAEIGGFSVEVSAEDLKSFSDEEFSDMLKEASLGGLEGYCKEAKIKDYDITEQGQTTWAGQPAYHIKTKGYSDEAGTSVIVDIIIIVIKEKARMYMFVSQVAESEYTKTKVDIESMIASFQIM